jgi:hypothetical protein
MKHIAAATVLAAALIGLAPTGAGAAEPSATASSGITTFGCSSWLVLR